ncbi:sensor protein [Micromonospora sp. ATCC 39149]|nr:sensor protein [Micromonospora sp. ATCC 39149]
MGYPRSATSRPTNSSASLTVSAGESTKRTWSSSHAAAYRARESGVRGVSVSSACRRSRSRSSRSASARLSRSATTRSYSGPNRDRSARRRATCRPTTARAATTTSTTRTMTIICVGDMAPPSSLRYSLWSLIANPDPGDFPARLLGAGATDGGFDPGCAVTPIQRSVPGRARRARGRYRIRRRLRILPKAPVPVPRCRGGDARLAPVPPAATRSGRGLMNTRDWPIRSKLTALVVAPVSALLALWIFATTLAFGPALDLLSAGTLLYDFGRPGETVVAELQRERRLTVVQLAGTGELPELTEQRRRTDSAIAELRRSVSGERLRDAAGDLLDARLDRLLGALDTLPAGRGFIDRRQVDRTGAIGLYSGMVGAAFQAFAAMAALPDNDLNRQALALTALGRSRELLGQADALLAGVLVTGRFAEGEHTQLVQTIGNQRFLADTAAADLPAADRTAYQRLAESEAFVRLRALQDELVRADPVRAPKVDARAWQASQEAVQRGLRDFELAQADAIADRTVPVAVGILARLGVAGVLGLAAIVASLLVSLRVGRSLARRLTAVRDAALDMAGHRLPDVVTRLRRGEDIDIAGEAPPLEYGQDEIGQVGRAFTEVGRTAVRSAVDEVTLRRGLNEVFLNIARRSQGLVHRQLALLDRMERRVEDPDELAELFRVDHLATRLRRHAEDLVILAGAAPGRGWRNPVAMVDLVRGAISEVESYDRVDIADVQPAATVGRAVGDVIHLLAELIENATAFSPPNTRVAVRGQSLPNGYAMEIIDQGLGMAAPGAGGGQPQAGDAAGVRPGPTVPDSGCSWSPGSPPGTGSGCSYGRPPTVGSPPWC